MSNVPDWNDEFNAGKLPTDILDAAEPTNPADSPVPPESRAPQIHREDVKFPEVDRDGKPYRDRRANTAALFGAYGVQVRYNRMTKGLEVTSPHYRPIAGREQNATLAWVQNVAADHGLSRSAVLSHIDADNRSYHPVEDWIASVPWDRTPRMQALFASLELDPDADPILCFALFRRWLVSCALAVCSKRRPGFATQGVLVLRGDQGSHKTRWIQRLGPPHLQAVLTGHLLDPSSRDNVQIATAHWIVELGEIDATFAKKDVAELKAFVTQPGDKFRSAYARREDSHPRTTVFAATVNPLQYLADETGNRRWWTVSVKRCQDHHGIDMQQLWAEVMMLAQADEPYWLTDEELAALEEANRRHEPQNPLDLALGETWDLSPEAKETRRGSSLFEIWRELPLYQFRPPNKAEVRQLGEALRRMGATQHRTANGQRFHVVRRPTPIPS